MSNTALNPLNYMLESLKEGVGELVFCRFCKAPITQQRQQATIGISHQHRFTNPLGVSYRISCYHQAPGCCISGEPTHQDSWFYGYRWQYVHCTDCGEHLGWYYQKGYDSSIGSGQRFFFGLISDRLTEQAGQG